MSRNTRYKQVHCRDCGRMLALHHGHHAPLEMHTARPHACPFQPTMPHLDRARAGLRA